MDKKPNIIINQKVASGLKQNFAKTKPLYTRVAKCAHYQNQYYNSRFKANQYEKFMSHNGSSSSSSTSAQYSTLETERQPLIDNSGGDGTGVGNSSYYDDSEFQNTNQRLYPPLNFDDSADGSSLHVSPVSKSSSTLFQRRKKMLVDKIEKRTTNMQTLMHILKGNIGTGILAMPNAFMNSGLYVGLVTLPILAILSTHCMHILIRTNGILTKRLGVGMLEYQEVTAHAFSIGPRCLRKYSNVASFVINLFLLITQFGFCCVYSLFVAENLSKVLGEFSHESIQIGPTTFLAILLPFFILLSFVKSLKHLSIASSMANLLQTCGLMIVMVNLVQDLPPTDSVRSYGSIMTFPLFMGTAIYAFEGIGLVLPLQKEMQHPKALGGYVGVLNTGMSLVACLNVAIGFFGYLKFGDKVAGSITLNLPAEPLYQYCKVIFALAIFLSYAIQYYVPFNIIWPWFKQKLSLKEDTLRTSITEYFLRAFIVFFTLLLAVAVPKLDLFISLVGAFSSSGLALMFPPIIDICARWNEDEGFLKWTWIFGKNILIILLGIFGFTTGTYASIINIIENFRK